MAEFEKGFERGLEGKDSGESFGSALDFFRTDKHRRERQRGFEAGVIEKHRRQSKTDYQPTGYSAGPPSTAGCFAGIVIGIPAAIARLACYLFGGVMILMSLFEHEVPPPGGAVFVFFFGVILIAIGFIIGRVAGWIIKSAGG